MWARVVTLLIGLWLMVAPVVLHYNKIMSNNGHITGPLIVTFSIIALSECTRNVQMFNLPLGAWLLFSPWVLGYVDTAGFASDYIAGVLILLFSLVKYKRKNRFAGGWPTLRKKTDFTRYY